MARVRRQVASGRALGGAVVALGLALANVLAPAAGTAQPAPARPPAPSKAPKTPKVPKAAAALGAPAAPDWPDAADAGDVPCGAPARGVAPRPPARGPTGRGAAASAVRGYLGLRLSEISEVRWTEAGRLVRYCAYPLVVSVEPASPAERAGLGAGDTLVAYGTRDLVRGGPVALDRLLVPGRTVRVRLRRDGRTLTRSVVVGELPRAWAHAPSAYGWSVTWPEAARALRGARARAAEPADPSPADGGRGDSAPRLRVLAPGRVIVRPPARPRDAAAVEQLVLDAFGRDAFERDRPGEDVLGDVGLPRAPVAPEPWVTYLGALPPLSPAPWAEHGPAALAGAQLVALDDDLREAVAGAPPRGVLVLKVLPDTPAAEAGLRAGDVVTAAAGRPVESPAALQRVLARYALAGRAGRRDRSSGAVVGAEGARRAVTLRVARGGAGREVVLRW